MLRKRRGRGRGVLRRAFTSEQWLAAQLALLALGFALLVAFFPDHLPVSLLAAPLLLGSIFLGARTLPWFVTFVMLCVTLLSLRQEDVSLRVAAEFVTMFALGLLVLVAGIRRSSLGVTGVRGESMLVDLRDQILAQGTIPQLPPDWDVQTALRSAGGTPFAGDFMVAARPGHGERLEIAVVDVSGKGEDAGTRALLLSGAFGGLLSALPPEEFLPAANAYVLRQDWEEGFATAIHLSLDLRTGAFEVRAAGHPPAVYRHAGSGRWRVLSSEGPVLGVIEGAQFDRVEGVCQRGDAVLLYTDGMVERPTRDIDRGIDRMLGETESLLRGSFDGAAVRLADALGARDDDRALVVLHRR